MRSNGSGFQNSGGAPAFAPPIPALVFRVSPSLYLSTLGAQRREGDLVSQPPSVRFRAGIRQAIAEIEARRVPAFAKSLETLDGQSTDALVHGELSNAASGDEIVEQILSAKRWKVEST